MRQFALITTAAFAIALPALPAQASNTAQSGSRDAQSSSRARSGDAEERRICIREQMGGSRITRPVCKTRAEWEALGVLERDR